MGENARNVERQGGMTEETMGILWAAMAAREGHRKRLPPSVEIAPDHPKAAQIRRLQAEGKTRAEIARIVSLSASRISQISKVRA